MEEIITRIFCLLALEIWRPQGFLWSPLQSLFTPSLPKWKISRASVKTPSKREKSSQHKWPHQLIFHMWAVAADQKLAAKKVSSTNQGTRGCLQAFYLLLLLLLMCR